MPEKGGLQLKVCATQKQARHFIARCGDIIRHLELALGDPIRAPVEAVAADTILATGRPLRVMMISNSFPCSMAFTKRDREDLAVEMDTITMV